MVNEIENIKEKILKDLYRAKGKHISGVSLSNTLNISRTAIWKHINALKQKGFAIVSCPKGYMLKNHDDLLTPFCFDNPKQFFYFHKLTSTMDKAYELSLKGVENLSVVIAEQQTKGRGRLDRKWFSPTGGLWFTLILKPHIYPSFFYIYTFAASLSLAITLRQLFNVNVFVKWPNDLLLNDKKLAGIVSYMQTSGDIIEFINIGIGLNVNNESFKQEPNSISLKNILKKNISRQLILKTFLENFKKQISNKDYNEIIGNWKKLNSTINKKVKIKTINQTYKGIAIDINNSTGALIIKDKKGKKHQIVYGDCFYIDRL